MTVYVLIREDQNDHGFIDTSIDGVFLNDREAMRQEAAERHRARAQRLIVEDDASPDGEWQVSWRIEVHEVATGAS